MNFITNMFNNKTNVIIFTCALSAIIIAILYVFKFNILESFTSKSYDPNSANSSEDNSSGEPVIIYGFFADWCPHCKVAKPEWNKISEKYNNKLINGRKVLFIDVDCTKESTESTELMKLYKVEGFPTIKLVKDKNVIDFDATPTADSLEQFVNTI